MILAWAFLLVPAHLLARYEIPDSYEKIETECCEFYYDGPHRAAVEELSESADGLWRVINRLIPAPDALRPRIIVTRTPKEFHRAQPYGGVSEWAAGVTYPEERLVILRLTNIGENPAREIYAIFAHELSHVALYSVAERRAFPRWFSEGLAQYQAGEWSMDDFTRLAQAAALGGLLSLSNIESVWPSDAATARLAYAQSARFISHLVSKFGDDAIKRLIGEVANGAGFKDAIVSVFGVNIRTLEKDFREDLKWYYVIVPIITGSSFLWFVMAILVIIGYTRYRVKRREKLIAMEAVEGAEVGMSGRERIRMFRLLRRKELEKSPEGEETELDDEEDDRYYH
ncbi:MAG: hypothetical protein Kow0090_23130 [Myxococcota bacterium]